MKRKAAMAMVAAMAVGSLAVPVMAEDGRSEEHTSELQSLE